MMSVLLMIRGVMYTGDAGDECDFVDKCDVGDWCDVGGR